VIDTELQLKDLETVLKDGDVMHFLFNV